MEWRKLNITGIRGIQHEKCTSINFDQDRPDAYGTSVPVMTAVKLFQFIAKLIVYR